jgi:hypothetical protein
MVKRYEVRARADAQYFPFVVFDTHDNRVMSAETDRYSADLAAEMMNALEEDTFVESE